MIEYPREFSPLTKRQINDEKIKAWADINEECNSWDLSEWEALIPRPVIRVSCLFAEAAIALGMEGTWDAHRVQSASEAFLREYTKQVFADPRCKIGGHSLRALMKIPSLDQLQLSIEESPEWRSCFKEKLSAVVEVQSATSSSGSDVTNVENTLSVAASAQVGPRRKKGPIAQPPRVLKESAPAKHHNSGDAGSKDKQREAVITKVGTPSKYTVLTTPEAALYFEVQPRTIHRWKGEGKLEDGAKRGAITIASVKKLQRSRIKARKEQKDL